MHTTSLYLFMALMACCGLAIPAAAQDANCRQNTIALNEIDTFDRSFHGGFIDGGRGIDTFVVPGPNHLSLRTERFHSLERIELSNGLFDTVLVEGDLISSTEEGQIEFVTDPFDQIFADPRMQWHRSIDDVSGGQVFTTTHDGVELSFRTDLGTHVILPATHSLVTVEGPEGAFQLMSHAGIAGPPSLLDRRLSWDEAGLVLPELTSIAAGPVTLDMHNGQHNVIGLDLGFFGEGVARELHLEADATDRVVLLQPDCWAIEEGDPGEVSVARFGASSGTAISITADAALLRQARTGTVVTAVAGASGTRHLNADLSSMVDEIDLRNGGRDVVILRNAGMRHDTPVIIAGDPGLDEIWIEGSAGWQVEYGAFGATVSTPVLADGRITIALHPGLGLRLLPSPPFLTHPSMAQVPFYPGTPDRASDGSGLYLTRGGIVRLSQLQLNNWQRLTFRNGIANSVHLDFSQALNDENLVTLFGDPRHDHLVISGEHRHTTDESGAFIWRIPRGDDSAQEIRATGFSYVAYTD